MFELLTSKLEPFTERVCIVWPILAFWTRKETLLSIVAAMFHVLVFAVVVTELHNYTTCFCAGTPTEYISASLHL